MRNLLTLLFMLYVLTLVGCNRVRYVNTVDEKVVEVPGPEVEVEVEKEVYIAQDFEAVYYFDNGGYVEMIASEDNEVTILDSGFQLVVKNKLNDTFANFPRVTAENLEVNDGAIVVARNVNYGSSNQYDLERDDNGQNITGNRYTVMRYELQDDSTVKLKITIFEGSQNNNINDKIFERTLRSF